MVQPGIALQSRSRTGDQADGHGNEQREEVHQDRGRQTGNQNIPHRQTGTELDGNTEVQLGDHIPHEVIILDDHGIVQVEFVLQLPLDLSGNTKFKDHGVSARVLR